MIFHKMKKINASTAKAFESKVKAFIEEAAIELNHKDTQVIRGDHKNLIPDWLVINKSKVYGVECKNYRAHSTLNSAIKAWKRKQPNQHRNFTILKKSMNIIIFFNLRDETCLLYTSPSPRDS